MTTTAYVNHGRWVVDCACGAAERMWPGGDFQTDQKTGVRCGFRGDGQRICGECGHTDTVTLPDEQTRAGIMSVLGRRPDVATRNWTPGETVADLAAENIEHGVD